MNDAELDRLAELIAQALLRGESSSGSAAASGRDSWLPVPVRPELSPRSSDPPAWSGAAQPLSDVAPSRDGAAAPPAARASTAELTRATRAAAAGKGAPPGQAPAPQSNRSPRVRSAAAGPIAVTLGVSNRHLHLSPEHHRALFGDKPLTVARPITQPGQFAAQETVAVVGPKGRIEAVRVVGPARGETQLELALSDAATLGVEAQVAASGSLDQSVGGVALVGPAGRVDLSRGVIIAARHLHLSPADARRWGLVDGDRLDVRCGEGARAVTFHDVLVRSGDAHATELHLDADEARAAAVRTGADAAIVAWRRSSSARRALVTERDVLALARRGERLPAGALLTPSARDRARALGLLAE